MVICASCGIHIVLRNLTFFVLLQQSFSWKVLHVDILKLHYIKKLVYRTIYRFGYGVYQLNDILKQVKIIFKVSILSSVKSNFYASHITVQ